jgi:hypothetical protein
MRDHGPVEPILKVGKIENLLVARYIWTSQQSIPHAGPGELSPGLGDEDSLAGGAGGFPNHGRQCSVR